MSPDGMLMNPIVRRISAWARPRWEPDWLLRAGVVVCALLALALGLLARISAPDPGRGATLIGHAAPTFTLQVAQNGRILAEAGYTAAGDNHPTLLVFFNTLCIHCLSEIPAARQAASATTAGSINLVFIDSPGESAQITGAYMGRLRLDPPVLLDAGGKVARAYDADYRPTLVLVDRAGVVRAVWTGETSVTTLRAGVSDALRR
jgi:thiol-disulfide isomerase/thioredoxin